MEFSLDKQLRNGLYALLTVSVYESNYKTLTGRWYNTQFNGKYSGSFTGGKEFEVGRNNNRLGINIKILNYGGYYRTPVDTANSIKYGRTLHKEDQPFTEKLPMYLRADLRLSYRVNHKKFSSVWSLDIQNVSNQKNLGGQYFDLETRTVKKYYQTPLLPIFSYKIEF
jgi:hypothetical protein